MEKQPRYRHELKYSIGYADFLALRSRLSLVMKSDPHTDDSGRYAIHSIYFDNCDDKALREKVNGISRREKFRIRYYNDDTHSLTLEKKIKHHGLCMKCAEHISYDDCRRMLSGDLSGIEGSGALLKELLSKMQTQLLRPRTVVRYSRVPFIYTPGNVRVTFDCALCTGLSADAFLDDAALALCSSPQQGGIILEVKYDEFLPDVIRTAVQPYCSRLQAFSKYAQCRSFG